MREPSTLTSTPGPVRDARRADQDRTLAAMHELEAALGAAAPGRESSWRAAVLAALVVLDEATDDEGANASNPDSLLSDIKRTQPRLRTRVRGLRTQYAHLRQTISSIRAELAKPDDDGTDFADVRQRLAWLLTALRHQTPPNPTSSTRPTRRVQHRARPRRRADPWPAACAANRAAKPATHPQPGKI